MSPAALEAFLARLYSDRPFLELFLAEPDRAMSQMHLDAHEQRSARDMDRAALLLAAHTYERKRAAHGGRRRRWPATALVALRAWVSRLCG